ESGSPSSSSSPSGGSLDGGSSGGGLDGGSGDGGGVVGSGVGSGEGGGGGGVGSGAGSGPSETTIVMDAPSSTRSPPAGVTEMTRPAATWSEYVSATTTLNPALRSCAVASACVIPSRPSGTRGRFSDSSSSSSSP